MSALPASVTRTLKTPPVTFCGGLASLIRRSLVGAVLPHSDIEVRDAELGRWFGGFAEVRCVIGGVPHIITIRAERDALELEAAS
jgi:hypothetical protein